MVLRLPPADSGQDRPVGGQAGQRWVCRRVSHGVHEVSVGRQLLHREVRPHLA